MLKLCCHFNLRLFLIAVTLIPQLSPAKTKPAPSQRIISSDASGLTISFQVHHWSAEDFMIDGKKMSKWTFADANIIEKAGQPQIPYHTAIIGIPQGAAVNCRIVSSESEPATDIMLLPFPSFVAIDGEPRPTYKPEAAIYQSTEHYPGNPLKISSAGWLRSQQIVRLDLAAIRYLPNRKQVEKLNNIVVRIDFAGSSTQQQPRIFSENEESWYRSLVLNYEQAKLWRKSRQRSQQSIKRTAQETTFYTFKLREEGIYKIDGRTLESNIPGLALQSIDPSKIRLYNNGGREVPRNLLDARPAGILENAIIVNDGGDGRFDRDDYLLFYGRGVEGWHYDVGSGQFNHYINHYGFDNIYWLTINGEQDGKRMQQTVSAPALATVINEYQGLYFLEEENENPIRSGLNWFGRKFSVDEFGRSHSWNATLPNAQSQKAAEFRFRFVALNQNTHRFDIQINGAALGTSQFTGNPLSFGQYVNMRVGNNLFNSDLLIPGENRFQISYGHSTNSGEAFLDWLEVLYPARLSAIDDELFFFTMSPQNESESYRIDNFSENQVSVFDITDFANVREITNAPIQAGTITFTENGLISTPRKYATVGQSGIKPVSELQRVELNNLRRGDLAGEFIIITHDDFASEALRLESYRRNGSPHNRIEKITTVKISDIYNNFSAGMMDPLAIRDFLKYAYDNWAEPRPLYVLLLGDGDYDYKNRIVRTDMNWIPTFQSDQVGDDGKTLIGELVSRTTDSGFTYLTDDDYRSAQNISPRPMMDLAIGRLNVQTIAEAQSVIDKIISYETNAFRDEIEGTGWRNTVTVVGDDELVRGGEPMFTDTQHIEQAEIIAQDLIPNSFDVKKIYLSEFPKVISASSGGVTKPAAKEALIRQMNQGTLIVNYIGHGNSIQWAHEHVFDQADNDRIQNQNRLIFFVAATCDWALFDEPQRQSQAEELLLFKDRGAIAMLSSARLVFSTTNFQFNQHYYRQLFNESGPTNRIGDAFVGARLRNSEQINDEKYHVYGDPTLRLAVPELVGVITSLSPDSILALSTMEVEGEVRNDQLLSDFNGKALVTTFDSQKKVISVPEAGSRDPYFLPGNAIYRGTVPVIDGKFKAKFIVPKDISYGGNLARISTYFWNESTDGIGYQDNINVSSTSSNLVDGEGPEIKIFFRESPNFTTGDIINENVNMVIQLADTVSGINIAGEIGHRLTLAIDPTEETCLSELNRFNGLTTNDLNDLFRFDEGDFLRGQIEFPVQFPSEVDIGGRTVSCTPLGGEQRHTLVVKAWDNANNSSTASVEVRVVHQDGLVLEEVMNYPNPFHDKTTFTFFTNQSSDVIIKIYTVSGQLIKTVEYPNAINGFNMVQWDGRDEQGDIPANGVYLYKITAKTESADGSLQSEEVGRLAIIR